MFRAHSFRRVISALFFTSALCAFGSAAASDDWQFKAEAYGWLPTIEGTLPTDDEMELTIDEILDYLEFTFMGGLRASKGRWSIVSDVVYLKLSADEGGNTTIPLGPLDIPTKVDFGVDMETWIVNLVGAYSLVQTDKHDVQLLAGARYFWLDTTVELDASVVPGEVLVDGSDEVLDPIVGVRGVTELSDKWWLNYRFDIGGGDSDLTWNAAVQFGRDYDWGSAVLGYRYLYYDFDSSFELLKDLDVYGPLVGVAWDF